MSKPSDVIIARYSRIERELDALGRTFGVKRLKPSQQMKVQGLTPDLDGDSTLTDPATGVEYKIPSRGPMFAAASVVEIDGNPVTFPRTRGELESMIDMLDQEGMEAVTKALTRLMSDQPEEGGLEAAKNSQGMPTPDSVSG